MIHSSPIVQILPRSAAVAWWTQHGEQARNWLALGLLLAAWNVGDDGGASRARRPDILRGYSSISVRATQRLTASGF